MVYFKEMIDLSRDFISSEPRTFKFKIGHRLASSLSGFIAGLIVASIVWFGIFMLIKLYTGK